VIVLYDRQKFLADCGTGGFVVMGDEQNRGGRRTYFQALIDKLVFYRVCLVIYVCFAVSL
jgi:hypothetical protein